MTLRVDIVREEISAILVNFQGYSVLERSMINKVLEENKFQQGGLVDDSQISEMGKMMGANSALVTQITIRENGTYYFSFKMIDVLTANVEKQTTARTTTTSEDYLDVIGRAIKEMFGAAGNSVSVTNQYSQTTNNESFTTLSKYSEGKEITFVCPKLTVLVARARGKVKVIFDNDTVWTEEWRGKTGSFSFKIRDPNPGKHMIKVEVVVYIANRKGEEREFNPPHFLAGGVFDIDTQIKDYYEFDMSMLNYRVTLEK